MSGSGMVTRKDGKIVWTGRKPASLATPAYKKYLQAIGQPVPTVSTVSTPVVSVPRPNEVVFINDVPHVQLTRKDGVKANYKTTASPKTVQGNYAEYVKKKHFENQYKPTKSGNLRKIKTEEEYNRSIVGLNKALDARHKKYGYAVQPSGYAVQPSGYAVQPSGYYGGYMMSPNTVGTHGYGIGNINAW